MQLLLYLLLSILKSICKIDICKLTRIYIPLENLYFIQFTNLILLILHIKSNLRKKIIAPRGRGGGENIIIPGGKISGSAHDTHVVLKYIYYLKYMYI